jgi:hypothetical protein
MSVNDNRESEENGYLHFKFTNLIKISVDDSKINIGVFESFCNLWKGTSVFAKSTYYDLYTINVKTGYTYHHARATLSNKGGGNKGRGIKNISYLGPNHKLPADALNHLKFVIDEKMKLVHGQDVPSFESYQWDLTFYRLICYVRTPYMCPILYNSIIEAGKRECYAPLRLKEILVKNDCRDPLQQMLSQSKIPNVKSLRRLVFFEPRGFPLLASISRTFKNIDVIRSLYTAYIDCRYGAFEKSHICYYNYCIDFSAKVFKTMVKHKGEKIIAAKMLAYIRKDKENNAYSILNDMIRCYDELKHCDFDFSKNFSIDELHFYLAASVSKQETENREIVYEKPWSFLEASDDKFSLSLAKDTHELISVGIDMSICVGSYANKAVNRDSTILILRNRKSNNPVGCIELNEDGVIQAKGFYNTLLQNEERIFIANWIKKKGLSAFTDDLESSAVDLEPSIEIYRQLCFITEAMD